MTQHALISRCEVTKNILQHQIFSNVFNYLVNQTRYRYLLSSMSIRDAVCHVLGNTCVKQIPGTLFQK